MVHKTQSYTFIILVMFLDRITFIVNANNHFAIGTRIFFLFQPRFGYIGINGKDSRWLHQECGVQLTGL